MPVVPTLEVENYLDFKTMTRYLKEVSSAAPHLVRVFSIGKSREGRHILVAEVTNRNLREGREKPGIWVDGGHQGWNLLGSTACLELLRFLVAGHGRDEFLTDLVDHTVFYIAPRLAPDEMELCLQGGALLPQRAHAGEAVSRQGRQFRIANELGAWKPFKRDHRVMVLRNPEDRKGQFYDLYRQLDGERLEKAGPVDFPSLEAATRLPLQLPSTRAVFEFMRSYENVFGAISTSGPGDRIDLVSGHPESRLIHQLGRRLGELAGLPFGGVLASSSRSGQFLSWVGQSLGVLATDCRMWSLRGAAGLKEDDLEDPFEADENEILQLLRFCEKEFPEDSFTDWSATEDPVLGRGEIGGWDWSRTWLNPPPGPYLARELKKLSRLALGLASAGPRLRIGSVSERLLGWSEDGQPLRQVSVTVENCGYMPTSPVGDARPSEGRIELNLGENVLLMGPPSSRLEELRGVGAPRMDDGLPSLSETLVLPERRAMETEFLIKGSAALEVVARHPLAGLASATSRPAPGMKRGSLAAAPAIAAEEEVLVSEEDPFEEVFPSFEELYQEPSPPEKRAEAVPPPPPPPPPPPALPNRPELPADNEFNIPDPVLPSSPPRPVQFGQIGEPPREGKSSPFPASKPAKGRVFGSPPQKPTGGLPAALTGKAPSVPKERSPSGEGEFSPLPLVKPKTDPGASAFEPLLPPAEVQPDDLSKVLGETIPGDVPAPQREQPEDEKPAAPPARLSRMSAPQLLRRQRGGQGPREPFKRS